MTITLNLSKETPMLNLTKAVPSLKRVRGLLNWNVHPVHGASLKDGFDLDIFAYVTGNGKIEGVQDVAFFNNKLVYNGAVHIPRDNRTGEGEEDEEVLIDFSKVPSSRDAVELFVFIDKYEVRKQNFSMVGGGEFTLFDADTGNVIQKYTLQQFATGTALHVGTLKRTGSDWGFQPVGDAAEADPNMVVQAYL